MNLLADLTPPQREAVEHGDGPLLVLAGPGSGKTRVVTRRIARLIERGVPSQQILAITFTNKAANEMRSRVDQLVPGARCWISTFHRFSAMLLRRYADYVGLRSNYTILDEADQRRAIRLVMQELDIDPKTFPPDRIAARISQFKNDMLSAEDVVERREETVGNHWESIVATVYPAYQKWMLESNAVDFDDLLLYVSQLLAEHDEIRRRLDAQHRYVLVDEYQDTNAAQYRIVAALSKQHPNLQVTGDPDQSIYGWRGARIENILRFERDYPDCRVIRLEQNFRSTGAIARSADRLIGHNQRRKPKRLITENPEGPPVELLLFDDGVREAAGVARRIRQIAEEQGLAWSDFAVLYRVNALSRQLETALVRERIPYQVAAGAAFYDRQEVKDVLAYVRLVSNPRDRAAFLRAVNSPLRGLGETSQRKLIAWADAAQLPLLDACRRSSEVPQLSKNAARSFRAFAELLTRFDLARSGSVAAVISDIIDGSGLAAAWANSPREEDSQRLSNVQELVGAAAQYDELAGEEASLEGFLEQTALVADVDAVDESAGRCTLLTMHSAKGLEFPVVFILALEEGLIPHERALRSSSPHELEEERRLLFVGMTRAKTRLLLTQTSVRAFRGQTLCTIASQFTNELECERVAAPAEYAPWFDPSEASPGGDDDDEPTIQVDGSTALSHTGRLRPLSGAVHEDDAASPRRARLMTGADLLKAGSALANVHKFVVGMPVRHPRYGPGVVVDVSRISARSNVTVQFQQDDRLQTFIAEKSPLQPIGLREEPS